MGWSEIKHAINSSVGTENFKPLNKIVEDAFNTIIGEQNSMKQKLSTGENDFYVDRAKNVDVDGFVGALEEYRTARIEMGSYRGTNSNPSITFSFPPKLLFIFGYSADGEINVSVLSPAFGDGVVIDRYINSVTTSVSGNTVEIYLTNVTYDKISASGNTYHYVAVG